MGSAHNDELAGPQGIRKCLHTLGGHADEVYAIDWAGDGMVVASGSKDRTVKLYVFLSVTRSSSHTGLLTGGVISLAAGLEYVRQPPFPCLDCTDVSLILPLILKITRNQNVVTRHNQHISRHASYLCAREKL